MGWKIRVLAFFFGLFSLALGAILIAIPVLLWVFWPWIRGLRNSQMLGAGKGLLIAGGSWMMYLGFFLIFLALVAAGSGGLFSPILFGVVGMVLVFYGRGSSGKVSGGLAPVRDSIRLRSRFVPWHWLALVEVKTTTQDVAKVLPNAGERLLVRLEGKASAYAVIQASGWTEAEAEAKVVSRMQELSRVLAPLGAFLMPVDAIAAASLVRRRGRPAKLDVENLEQSLASTQYDVISIGTHGHVVVGLGAYQSADDGQEQFVFHARQALRKPVLVWEVAGALERRAAWPGPDDETVFLSSLAATRGESIGDRIVENGSSSGTRMAPTTPASHELDFTSP
jgi:hypothetical protein